MGDPKTPPPSTLSVDYLFGDGEAGEGDSNRTVAITLADSLADVARVPSASALVAHENARFMQALDTLDTPSGNKKDVAMRSYVDARPEAVEAYLRKCLASAGDKSKVSETRYELSIIHTAQALLEARIAALEKSCGRNETPLRRETAASQLDAASQYFSSLDESVKDAITAWEQERTFEEMREFFAEFAELQKRESIGELLVFKLSLFFARRISSLLRDLRREIPEALIAAGVSNVRRNPQSQKIEPEYGDSSPIGLAGKRLRRIEEYAYALRNLELINSHVEDINNAFRRIASI